MSKWVINCAWNDVPHLTEDEKTTMRKAIPPHLRDAREFGLPSAGVGAVYPVLEHLFVTDPKRLPMWFERAYGLDVGWNNTAAVFGAYDKEDDIWYIYSEYLGQKLDPAINASAIRSRTQNWIRGVIDPASMGVSQSNGQTLFDLYEKNGLVLEKADNAVELGIFTVYQRLTEGRLIIFNNCEKILEEIRMYHRDDNGRIVKKYDHLMDALRYLIMSGDKVKSLEPSYEEAEFEEAISHRGNGKNKRTGY